MVNQESQFDGIIMEGLSIHACALVNQTQNVKKRVKNTKDCICIVQTGEHYSSQKNCQYVGTFVQDTGHFLYICEYTAASKVFYTNPFHDRLVFVLVHVTTWRPNE